MPDLSDEKLQTEILQTARNVLRFETRAIEIAEAHLDEAFCEAVLLMKGCEGNVLVSGVGKSGHIGKKFSATLASTGTPSWFLNAAEAAHGDLGRIGPRDLVLLLSYSGSTEEITRLAGLLKQNQVRTISMSRSNQTPLAKLCDCSIAVGHEIEEACQHGLTPTASTTAMLAVSDALAISVSVRRQFSAQEFNRSHPAGALGKLSSPVELFLRFKVGKNVAVANAEARLVEVLEAASEYPRRCGAILVVSNSSNRLAGLFTDSDLRRRLLSEGERIFHRKMCEVMTKSPHYLHRSDTLSTAVSLMQEKRIDELPIVDDDLNAIGILDIQDMFALELITNDEESSHQNEFETMVETGHPRLSQS